MRDFTENARNCRNARRGERYVLTIEPTVDVLNRPLEVRVRLLLKLARRGLALKCVNIVPDPQNAPACEPLACSGTAERNDR